jgi:hypothetical protein
MHGFILTGFQQLYQLFAGYAHLVTQTIRHENGDDLSVQILVHREGDAHGFIGLEELIRELVHRAFLPDEVILNKTGILFFLCAYYTA